MIEKLIRTTEVAEMVSLSPKVTRRWLADHGIQPVYMGNGRGKGLRWPLSCIQQLIRDMRDAAQSKGRKKKEARSALAEMSAADLFSLTRGRILN